MRFSLITPLNITDFSPHRSPSPDPSILTLILLRSGTLVQSATNLYGTYHDVYCTLFQNSLKFFIINNHHKKNHLYQSLNSHKIDQIQLQLVSYNVFKNTNDTGNGIGNGEPIEYPNQEILDLASGILITGSAATAYHKDDWITNLLEFCRTQLHQPRISTTTTTTTSSPNKTTPPSDRSRNLKWFGICFGHQIISRALGSLVTENPAGWELAVTEIELTENVGKLVLGDGPSGASVLRIHQFHKDHVPTLPPSTHSLGSTARCPHQGFVRFATPDPPVPFDLSQIDILTLQGHPEFLPDILAKTIDAREQSGVLSKEIADEARTRVNEHDDGVYIAAQLLKIMGI